MDENEKHVISRRSVMKRMGAGAALAWSAPVVSSLATPAFAQQGYPGPDPGGCSPGQDSCTGADFNCGGRTACFCSNTAEGAIFCGCFDRGVCGNYQLCNSSSQCPAGEFCALGPDCCNGICLRPCGPGCGGEAAPNRAKGGVSVPPHA